MRKFIATGVAALSAATMTFGFAGAAHAVDPAPTVIQQVCSTLPGSLASVIGQLTSSGVTLGNANSDLSAKQSALNTSVSNLIAAIVTQVQNVSGNLPTGVSTAVLNDAVADYSAKIVAWSNALTARDNAFRANQVLGISDTVLNGINGGLCTPAP